MSENIENISIFKLVEDWQNEGYGIALMEGNGDGNPKVITPYIDPSDYPSMLVSKSCNGATVTNMGEGNWYIQFHSGSLEEIFNKQNN